MAVGLGSRVSFICAFVQKLSGTALCVPASAFRGAASQNARIRDLIVRELQFAKYSKQRRVMPFTTSPAVCAAGFYRRVTKSTVTRFRSPIESLSKMLGVRRSTVSQMASALQAAGIIHTHRGKIKLLKRQALKKRTCECYEIPFGSTLIVSFQIQARTSIIPSQRTDAEKEGPALTSSFRSR